MSSPCWSCAKPADGLFCVSCGSLQQPPPDYFRFFELPRRLSLDTDDLQRRFYALSRKLHPDRYARGSAREQQCSLEATSVLNDGFRVLRDPIRRAEYVLKDAGLPIGEQGTRDVPPELLEEVFEMNMALEELKAGDDDARPQLEQSQRHFAGLLENIDAQLEESFKRYDQTGGHEVLSEIRAILNRRKYISNLIGEVERALSAAAA
jgi:molecular chaperone HscB